MVDLGPPQPKQLSEPQALLVLQETLASAGVRLSRDWPVNVGDPTPLSVDARIGDPPFGIEWATEEDRAQHGERLPHSEPGGALRIISGRLGGDQTVQVLVLDPALYGYEANPQRVQRGAPGINEAEERLRRDLADFLEYVRGQGGSL